MALILLMFGGAGGYGNNSVNGRSYIQATFSQPLVKDSMYCVNYWVNLGQPIPGPNIKAIKNVDAYINDTLLNWNNGGTVLGGIGLNLVGFTPQITSSHFLL